MSGEIITDALTRAGATFENGDVAVYSQKIVKADLYDLRSSVGQGSSNKRKILQKQLVLPENMFTNALLEVLNITTTKQELVEFISSGQL